MKMDVILLLVLHCILSYIVAKWSKKIDWS